MANDDMDLFQDAYDKDLPDIDTPEELETFMATLQDKDPEEIERMLEIVERKLRDLEETEKEKNEVSEENETPDEDKREEVKKEEFISAIEEKKQENEFENEIKKIEEDIKPVKPKKKRSWIVFLIILFLFVAAAVGILYVKFNSALIISTKDKLISDSLTTTGDGLYKDTYDTGLDNSKPFTSEYYYKGKNVNNYLVLEDSCFRIISISQNNTIKIMYEGNASNSKCSHLTDTTIGDVNINKEIIWDEETNEFLDSNIYSLLKDWTLSNNVNDVFKLNLSGSDSKIVDATWYTGKVTFNPQGLNKDINEERNATENTSVTSKLGLLTTTEYLKINCNQGAYDSMTNCKNNNYLYKEKNILTMTATTYDNSSVFSIAENGMVKLFSVDSKEHAVIPVMYLDANIKLTGNGSKDDPYIVKPN